jgi:hypothetical protein
LRWMRMPHGDRARSQREKAKNRSNSPDAWTFRLVRSERPACGCGSVVDTEAQILQPLLVEDAVSGLNSSSSE